MTKQLRRIQLWALIVTVTVLFTTPVAAQNEDVITLNFWVYGFGENPEFISMIDRWNANNPHIQVNRIAQPLSGREDRVLIALATNTAPDILMATSQEIVSFADQGYIVPLDEYITAAAIDLSIFFPTEVDTFRWDDNLWALPWPTTGGQESLMFFNRDIFAEVGLDPDMAPRTWGDLESVATRVNRIEDGKFVRMGLIPTQANTWNRLLYANNGHFLDSSGRHVMFDRPEAQEALEWIMDLTHVQNRGMDSVKEFLAVSGGETTRFAEGSLGVVFNNVSFFPRWKNDGVNFGAGLIPYNENNPEATHRSTAGRLYGWGHVIPQNTPVAKRDAAFEFIEFLTTNLDGGCSVLKALGRPSPLRECTSDPIFYDINPYWAVVGEALDKEVRFPMTPVHREVQVQFTQAYNQVVGGASPGNILPEAARVAQTFLDLYWSEKDQKAAQN